MAVTKKAMAKMATAEMTMTKPVMAVASAEPAVTPGDCSIIFPSGRVILIMRISLKAGKRSSMTVVPASRLISQ